jgi:DNA polymerase family A
VGVIVDELRAAGVGPGDLVAVAVADGVGLGLALPGAEWSRALSDGDDPGRVVADVEAALAPRWVVWSNATTLALVQAGVRVATCWDVAAVQRLLFGGWRADPGRVWAQLHDLPLTDMPSTGPVNLFSLADAAGVDPDQAVRPDGYLAAEWAGGDAWAATPERLARWAALAARVAGDQQVRLAALAVEHPRVTMTARVESAAELLCAEMTVAGLPVDRAEAEAIVAGFVGPRPRSEAEAAELRARRDAEVLRHVPADSHFDLRSPGQVRSLLRRVGIEVPDTRAWRLEALRDEHPVVDALLTWRKAERVATTYGYGWLDQHVGPDGRLRGEWSGSDGAAGRMTASAGLHNMPSDMRPAVVAVPGHVFVRADLGQIEPRVLAAVSGDPALAQATADDDMYAPVARQLGVDRATAKVAVLGTMYGQTTGHGAQLLPRLRATYPVAMAYLEKGDRSGQFGRDLRTYGGRLVRMSAPDGDASLDERAARSRAAARGRYGRNALVQGAAAELFKVWAATVRTRGAALDAEIVLCLHDELLVHVPEAHGRAAADLVAAGLQEAAHRWSPTSRSSRAGQTPRTDGREDHRAARQTPSFSSVRLCHVARCGGLDVLVVVERVVGVVLGFHLGEPLVVGVAVGLADAARAVVGVQEVHIDAGSMGLEGVEERSTRSSRSGRCATRSARTDCPTSAWSSGWTSPASGPTSGTGYCSNTVKPRSASPMPASTKTSTSPPTPKRSSSGTPGSSPGRRPPATPGSSSTVRLGSYGPSRPGTAAARSRTSSPTPAPSPRTELGHGHAAGCAPPLACRPMPSRLSLVKKAAGNVLEAGEQLEAACMVSLPGTMKREGRQAMLRGALGVQTIQIDDDAFPEKLIAATTDKRILLFEQSMFGRAKQLVAQFPLAEVAGVQPTGTSRAQVSLKLLNFTITLRDGSELPLESADRKGAEELIHTAQARLGTA